MNTSSKPFIHLASRSPRRAELLRQLGVAFEIAAADVDETPLPGEVPQEYVRRLARDKADAALRALPNAPVAPLLAADTAVAVDTAILGKPRDRVHAVDMLLRLAGRSHHVLSALALWTPAGMCTALSLSEVRFRAITRDEAQAYWETGEPADKAGGYAIQGRGALFVEHLSGSYSGVMGLPLFETAQLLRDAGMEVLMRSA